MIEVALGRFPFSDDDDSSDEEDAEDDEGLPDELKGTLSPNSKPDLEAAARAAKERARKDKKKKTKAASPGMTGNGSQMSILDLLQHIVNEPAPKLPRDDARFDEAMCGFVDSCLNKEPSKRPSPKELTGHDYVKAMASAKVDLLGWVKTLK